MLQFEAMAIGALGAYWVFHRKKEVSGHFLFSRTFQVIIFAIIVAKLGFNNFLSTNSFTSGIYNSIFNLPIASAIFLYCLFLWLVINISLNKKRIVNLENKAMDKLGDISYGIYMYHMLLIFILVFAGKKLLLGFNIYVGSLVYYAIIGSSVIIVAYFSKVLMEDNFLKLKKKFS